MIQLPDITTVKRRIKLSHRLDIDFDASNNTRLNASYAYALKAPTVDNIYSVQYARATATATALNLDVSRIHAYQASVINLTEGW